MDPGRCGGITQGLREVSETLVKLETAIYQILEIGAEMEKKQDARQMETNTEIDALKVKSDALEAKIKTFENFIPHRG